MKNVTESQSNDDTNNIPVITSKNIITIMLMIPGNNEKRDNKQCLLETPAG